jgi:Tol biopolymer transport system component
VSERRRPIRRVRTTLAITIAIGLLPATAHAQFPGENGVIAFGRLSSAVVGIATIEAPGGDPTLLTESRGFDRRPSYSPDGSRIAFIRGTNVWVMGADGSDQQRLTRGRASEGCPRWAPDGSMIVYDRGGDLWTVDADAADPERIARTRADEYCPSWSPDGSTIAFVLEGPGRLKFDIALMAPDGSDRRRVTADRRTQFAPDWSPDGSSIVYNEYDRFSIASIVTIEPDGTDPAIVFDGERCGALDPVFSPDGLQVAFVRGTGCADPGDIWVVDADGDNLTRATRGRAHDTSPGWQPVPVPG